MDPNATYFSKQLSLNDSGTGEGFIDLFQHFPNMQMVNSVNQGSFGWEVAVQELYAVQKKGCRQAIKAAGTPLELKCSHSFYMCKMRYGEMQKNYNLLGLYQVTELFQTEGEKKEQQQNQFRMEAFFQYQIFCGYLLTWIKVIF